MIYRIVFFMVALMVSSTANAQVVTNLTDPTYLAVTTNYAYCGFKYCVNSLQGIPLSYFATSASVANMNQQISSEFSKAYELSAITAAMGDAMPNPGDRFAVRLQTAGFLGQAAGALGLSYNVTDEARLSLNLGQGHSQTVASGGVTFSLP